MTRLARPAIVFVALTIGGLGMAVAGRDLATGHDQLVLVAVGAAVVAGSLAAFLGRVFTLDAERPGPGAVRVPRVDGIAAR